MAKKTRGAASDKSSPAYLTAVIPTPIYKNVKFAVQRARYAYIKKIEVLEQFCSNFVSLVYIAVGVVVYDTTIAATGANSITWPIKSDPVSPTVHYRCDVFFSELRCPGAESSR